MGRVRKVTGQDVMGEAEFAEWWSRWGAGHLGEVFIDVLRRHLAGQLQVKNFRQLALVRGDELLSADSHWIDADLVVVIRPYVTDTDGGAALVEAALSGDLAGVVNLLDRPLDPDTRADYPCEDDLDDGPTVRGTPLQLAVESGHQQVVHCLLQAGADKDKIDDCGRVPLHVAAQIGHEQIVHCLLQAGADKDKADSCGRSPVHIAAQFGHYQIVHCLILVDADNDETDNYGSPRAENSCPDRPSASCALVAASLR